jgi:hypothetical protein
MWLQRLVNEKPHILKRELLQSKFAPQVAQIAWLSPRKDNGFAEYSDADFLELIGHANLHPDLAQFWPSRGPVWDGLATAVDNVFLVEAKAHIGELASPASGAGEKSLEKINTSLASVKAYLGVKPEYNWTGHFYQYTNRLAHLYFLRELDVKAYLVFVYFLNDTDMKGPANRAEWEAALHLMHLLLGTGRHKLSKYVIDIFVDTHELQP